LLQSTIGIFYRICEGVLAGRMASRLGAPYPPHDYPTAHKANNVLLINSMTGGNKQ